MIHELKIEPQWYWRIVDGSKTFEVRRNDRGFQAGDTLRLREWLPCATPILSTRPGAYSGNSTTRHVTFVYSGEGVEHGYVVLGLAL